MCILNNKIKIKPKWIKIKKISCHEYKNIINKRVKKLIYKLKYKKIIKIKYKTN